MVFMQSAGQNQSLNMKNNWHKKRRQRHGKDALQQQKEVGFQIGIEHTRTRAIQATLVETPICGQSIYQLAAILDVHYRRRTK